MSVTPTVGGYLEKTAVVLDAVFNASTNTLQITPNGSSIFTLPYDYIGVAYPTGTTEQYTTRVGGSGGSVQQLVTVTYTDSDKTDITSVARS